MIPVFQPEIGEEEIQAVAEAIRRGEISGSFGSSIPEFEKKLAAYVGCRHGIAVTSGTTALHLAVRVAGIGPGDEVLVSASTNIATALAVYYHGAVPVPVDSDEETWNLDLDLLDGLLTPRTKAVMPVHLFGHPVDMDRLMAWAKAHSLIVIEDCAESHGATCRGKMTGSFGQMSCYSFYANKIITTGEGGMILTDDDALAGRLRLLRNLAFTTPRFRHVEAGYNFRMTGFQAAMGVKQCEKLESVIERKRLMAAAYSQNLAGIQGLQLPVARDWARHVYWMYGLLVKPAFGISRDALMQALLRRGIDSRTFFCPMNMQPCFQEIPGFRAIPCPVAERLWEQGLYLPSSQTLSQAEIVEISAAIRSIQREGA